MKKLCKKQNKTQTIKSNTHKAQHDDTSWLGLSSAVRGQGKTSETSSSGSASDPC